MLAWLRREAAVVEAVAAAITALVAVLALAGVVYQVREASNLAALQSARDAYRNHLALAATVPDLAAPEQACTLINGEKAGAYDAYVGHLLYAAEQMLEQRPDWSTLFERELEPHLAYLCTYRTEFLTEGALDALLARMVDRHCATVPPCG